MGHRKIWLPKLDRDPSTEQFVAIRQLTFGGRSFKQGEDFPVEALDRRQIRRLFDTRKIGLKQERFADTPGDRKRRRQADRRAATTKRSQPPKTAGLDTPPTSDSAIDANPPAANVSSAATPVDDSSSAAGGEALTAKHRGGGRWYVMRGDEVVSGPHSKSEAEAAVSGGLQQD